MYTFDFSHTIKILPKNKMLLQVIRVEGLWLLIII